MWKSSIPTTMQDFGDYCKNMVQDDGSNGNSISITLRDTRDNNTYTVAKLKDGKCWMTQNLRLGDGKLNNRNLTPADTNIATNFSFPSTSYCNTSYYPYDGVAGDGTPRYCNTNNATWGNLYNWYAATASSGSSNQQSGNALYSICPKGWKLPTNIEAQNMANLYANAYFSSPTNFVQFGVCTSYYGNGVNCPVATTEQSDLWTSSLHSFVLPYEVLINSNGSIQLRTGWEKDNADSVRCIAS